MRSWRRSIVECLDYLADVRVVEDTGIKDVGEVVVVE